MAEVSEKPHRPFLTGPVDHRAVCLSTGVSALSSAQALLRGGFQPSAIPSAFSMITCTDHFHESGLSHLHRRESRAANPSTVFLQSFRIHRVPCRRFISCASERRIGQHRERTLESGRVGSSPHCTTQRALWLGQVRSSVSAGAQESDRAYCSWALRGCKDVLWNRT